MKRILLAVLAPVLALPAAGLAAPMPSADLSPMSLRATITSELQQ